MTTHTLAVWIGEQQVGILVYRDGTGRFSFEYETSWAGRPDAYPGYTDDERTTLQDIADLALQQAGQLESDAKMIGKVVLE